MKLKSPYLVKPDAKLKLSRIATDDTGLFKREDAANAVLDRHCKQLASLQEIFYASQQKALLIVLQGMDTAGKDGAISHIFSGINPQGCNVSAFKEPTPLEARHDFLWRVHAQVPPRGMIQIFNRSHYEDILVPRVHKLIYEEQARRLQSRLDTPDKHWKLSESDFREREFWPRYEDAYNHLIGATSRKHAPWFIIPSDHKWFRNVAISQILVEAMKSLKLEYPKPTMDPTKVKL